MNPSTTVKINHHTNNHFKRTHKASNNSLRVDSNAHRINNEHQSVTVEYASIESFHDHLMYAAIAQGSIFSAMDLIREAGNLNKGLGLPENYIREIKMSFIHKDRKQHSENHFVKNKSRQKKNVENKVSYLEKQNSFPQKELIINDFEKNEFSNIERPFAGIEFHNKQRVKNKVVNREIIHREMVKGYLKMQTKKVEIRL